MLQGVVLTLIVFTINCCDLRVFCNVHEQKKTMQEELLIRSLRGPLCKNRRNGVSDKRDFGEIFLKLMWISIMSYFNQLRLCHVSEQKEYKTKHIESQCE